MSTTTTEPPPAPAPVPIDAYYDSARKCYLIRDKEGTWMPIDRSDLKMRLAKQGYSARRLEGFAISNADEVILRIQDERHVAYAGPLAGYRSGTHMINGSKVLVTQSPSVVPSVEGDWSISRQLYDNMWEPEGDEEIDQRILYWGWIKLADEQLRQCIETGNCTYGQSLIMCGARGCGKSLTQTLITDILGGRSAAPFGYMSGGTPFNRELFAAEHQMIEDEQPHKDYRNRVRFGEAIKQISATVKRPCYGKNREAQSLTPFWRLSLSVNDEPDHLGVLPPLEDTLIDKIIILHCRKKPMPMPAATGEEKRIFYAQLTKELPAFMHWIRNVFVIPDEYKDTLENRYGLMHFVHPHILTLIDDMAPETQLLSLIDHCLFDTGTDWSGTSEELIRCLTNNFNYGSQARSVVGSSVWCGKLLSKLAKSQPKRVQMDRTATFRKWLITMPSQRPPAPPSVTSNIPDLLDIPCSA